jgi:hypothetical protein
MAALALQVVRGAPADAKRWLWMGSGRSWKLVLLLVTAG